MTIDRNSEPHRLYVELKMQGLPLERHWLAVGTDAELDEAWATALRLPSNSRMLGVPETMVISTGEYGVRAISVGAG